MAHDVFISYSSPDKAVADAVCATLESRKIRCWIAPRDVLPGKPYGEALIDALNNSKVMVLVFSASANDSPQVMREVERAVNKGIPIIPLRIENVMPSKSMEYFLSAPHWLDALTPPMERHLQKLADAIEILLGTAVPQKAEARFPGKSGTKVESKGKTKPVFIIAGIVVVAIIILAIFLTRGGDKDQDHGLTSNITSTKPVATGTSTPMVTPTTTSPATAKPTSTSTPTPKGTLKVGIMTPTTGPAAEKGAPMGDANLDAIKGLGSDLVESYIYGCMID